MATRDRTVIVARLAAGVLLAAAAGPASAHGAGGLSHMAAPASLQAQASRATSPAHSAGMVASPTYTAGTATSPGRPAGMAANATPGTGSAGDTLPATGPTISTLPPSVATQCEGEVSVNCEATARSRNTVSNGDFDPIWSAPVPTAVPPTPPTDPIVEPQDAAEQNFEQSGGASGVAVAVGGGPTLADCMSLWEPSVHMTRPLWKDVCIRTMNGIEEPQVALGSVDPGYGARRRHATRETHRGRMTSGLARPPHS